MPTVPLVRPKDWQGVQLPSVMSVDVRPWARGAQMLARGMVDAADAAGAGADMVARIRERKQQEQEMALVADWRLASAKAWDGTPADAQGLGARRGARDFGVDDGSATQYMRQAWREWRDNPDGLWATASPAVRRRAELALRMESESAFIQAARKDVALNEQRAAIASEAALGAAEAAASAFAYDDVASARSSQQAAEQVARVKSARFIVNPDESDAQKLEFRLEEGKQVYEAVRGEALDKLRKARAVRIIADAGNAESEPLAVMRMRMAEQVIEGLTPERKMEMATALESIKAKRLDGMLGVARAADDLDQRERLAEVAEQAAGQYKPDGKLLAGVKEEVRRIRNGAQQEENHLALGMLARGEDYEGYMGASGKNTRREEALVWAKQKMAELEARKLRTARSEQARELTARAQYVGAMLGNGLWLDEQGNVVSVDMPAAHALLAAQLASGNIRITDFAQQKARLDAVEKSGKKERYKREAQRICEGLGVELGTVWRDGRLELDAKEEEQADKVALKYRVAEQERSLERERVRYRKQKLLRSELPKLMDLLVAADEADGMMLDLDNDPATPKERMDAVEWKRKLIGDLKRGLLLVDLDTQADMIYEAVTRARQDRQYQAGRAMSMAAMMQLPESAAGGSSLGGAEEDAWEDDDE